MTDVLPDLLAQIDRGPLADRCRAIAAIGRLGEAAASAVPRLIAQFDDTTIAGTRSTDFGATGDDPGRDFLAALAAVDALVAIGEPAHAPILEILHRTPSEPRHYYAQLTAGRLHLAEAIPLLEAAIAAQQTVWVRCNFDQCDEYPLHEAALAALVDVDPARARATLDRLLRDKHSRGRTWAVYALLRIPGGDETLRRLISAHKLDAAERKLVPST